MLSMQLFKNLWGLNSANYSGSSLQITSEGTDNEPCTIQNFLEFCWGNMAQHYCGVWLWQSLFCVRISASVSVAVVMHSIKVDMLSISAVQFKLT